MFKEVKRALLNERLRQMQTGFSQQEIDGYSDFVFVGNRGTIHHPTSINQTLKRIINAYNTMEVDRAKKKDESLLCSRTFQSTIYVIHSAHAFAKTKPT